MQGWLKLTWVEAKLFIREPIVAFFSMAFPLMLLFLFGSIYGNEPSRLFGGHGLVDVYVPAYIALVIGTNGLLSLPITIVNYRESGVLLRLQATPLRPQAILLAEIVVNFLMTTVGALLLIVAGKVVYNLHFLGDPFTMFVVSTVAQICRQTWTSVVRAALIQSGIPSVPATFQGVSGSGHVRESMQAGTYSLWTSS